MSQRTDEVVDLLESHTEHGTRAGESSLMRMHMQLLDSHT